MKSTLKALLVYAGIFILLAFTLGPFIWLISSSFKPTNEIFTLVPHWIPHHPTLNNYIWAFESNGGNMWTYLKNSLVACGLATGLIMILGTPAGYAMGRFKFPGREIVGIGILLLQMLQGPLVIIFWYKFAWQAGLLDTYYVLAIAYTAINLPFIVWLTAGFMSQLPKALEDAALIDGCNYKTTFLKIILPISLPGLVALSLYAFVQAWNDYLYALILTQTPQSQTIQIGLSDLLSFFSQTQWGGLMAGGVMATLPPVLLFMYFQKYLVKGLWSGAVKG